MSISLFDFQVNCQNQIYEQWTYYQKRNVILVLPTGAGKTVVFSDILKNHRGYAVAIAHRQELVSQIALSLARMGVRHSILAPKSVIRFAMSEQILELGKHYYSPRSSIMVAGVDTLLKRKNELKNQLSKVTLWVLDEAHHLLLENKWGKVIQCMPNAYGLGVTATACRADGKGLARWNEGLFDSMVVGPGMRELINRGFLTDYKIFAPPTDLNLNDVTVSSATGDFNTVSLRHAVEESHLVGDVVEQYLKIAPGKLGVTFATDVKTAKEIADKYNQRGVSAVCLTAKSKPGFRADCIRRFRNREIMNLVNVDLFGEGFDLPAIEVASMARPTQSYALYVQQFGRSLRTHEGKQHGIIIDHANNVVRHGLPDRQFTWSLQSTRRRPASTDDDIPLRYCVFCTQPYERIHKLCPYCGEAHIPESRSNPEFVDGDLTELDEETLRDMRGQVERIDRPAEVVGRSFPAGTQQVIVNSAMKNHRNRYDAQLCLRDSIKWWAGFKKAKGYSDSEIYRVFFYNFNVDILSAQSLGKPEALELANRINHEIGIIYANSNYIAE